MDDGPGWPGGSSMWGPDGWPWDPAIYGGGVPQMPLAFDFPAEIETPDAQRMFAFELPRSQGANAAMMPPSLGTLRMFGQLWQPPEAAREALQVPDAVATDHPSATNERLDWFDVAECIDVASNQIALGGTAWELGRWVVQRYNLLTLERIGFRASVTALDEDGEPLATTILDGEDPCAVPIVHPDPAVANPLAFRFLVQVVRVPLSGDGILPPLLRASAPNLIPSSSPVIQYPDLRFGWREGWPHLNQFVGGGRSLLRYILTIDGDPDRWSLRMMGRISGYTQQPGRTDAAHQNAVHRL